MSDLEKLHNLEWTYLAQLCESVENDIVIAGGEGGIGSDGFVAVLRTSDRHLMWLAFFDDSNPFIKVSFLNGIVIAFSNLGDVWNFPLEKPHELKVVKGRPTT